MVVVGASEVAVLAAGFAGGKKLEIEPGAVAPVGVDEGCAAGEAAGLLNNPSPPPPPPPPPRFRDGAGADPLAGAALWLPNRLVVGAAAGVEEAAGLPPNMLPGCVVVGVEEPSAGLEPNRPRPPVEPVLLVVLPAGGNREVVCGAEDVPPAFDPPNNGLAVDVSPAPGPNNGLGVDAPLAPPFCPPKMLLPVFPPDCAAELLF